MYGIISTPKRFNPVRERVKMANRKFPYELLLEQVKDGKEYKGQLVISNIKFEYNLLFEIPIDRLEEEVEEVLSQEELRRQFQVTVKKDGSVLDLSKEEYLFFFATLSDSAIDFYFHPQTRHVNQKMLDPVVRGEGRLAELGAKATISEIIKGEIRLEKEQIDLLSAPKFGCIFTNA